MIEGMCNKVDFMKDSQKAVGKSEECSDSKEIQRVLNARTFKYHYLGG